MTWLTLKILNSDLTVRHVRPLGWLLARNADRLGVEFNGEWYYWRRAA